MSTFEDLVSRAKVHTRCILGRHHRFRFPPRCEFKVGLSNLRKRVNDKSGLPKLIFLGQLPLQKDSAEI